MTRRWVAGAAANSPPPPRPKRCGLSKTTRGRTARSAPISGRLTPGGRRRTGRASCGRSPCRRSEVRPSSRRHSRGRVRRPPREQVRCRPPGRVRHRPRGWARSRARGWLGLTRGRRPLAAQPAEDRFETAGRSSQPSDCGPAANAHRPLPAIPGWTTASPWRASRRAPRDSWRSSACTGTARRSRPSTSTSGALPSRPTATGSTRPWAPRAHRHPQRRHRGARPGPHRAARRGPGGRVGKN